jgi:HAD superfamily hydrolase (TIGR01509 family)
LSTLGFIFDLDGTIIDSTAQYRETWTELLDEFGSGYDPEEFMRRATRDNFRILLGDNASPQELEAQTARQAQIGNAKMRAARVQAHEGILELIAGLKARGVKLAVATAAERTNAEWALQELGLRACFEAAVVDEDVEQGKPAPDVYLEAMRRLGIEPLHCAAIEDSATGVRAAKAAGLRVIGVITTHSPRELEQAGADWIVASAGQLNADAVIRFIEE